MQVLFVNDARPHAHDYGVDFLIQGAYSLLGAENVFEWLEKPNLHLAIGEDRDECQIDSDAWLPVKHPVGNYPQDMDVIILTSAWGTADVWQQSAAHLSPAIPVIGLHYDDELTDTRQHLERITRRPLAAYWHREQPPSGVRQLWLSQPLSRVRPVVHKRALQSLFYHGASQGLATRRTMAESLRAHVRDTTFVELTPTQKNRLRPEVYRERLWESSVSVVWNSGEKFPVWQSNRFFESLALGCAVVAERPLYNTPAIDGITWIDSPEDAGPACAALLAAPVKMRENARVAQESFIRCHTSEEILKGVLASVGLETGDGHRR